MKNIEKYKEDIKLLTEQLSNYDTNKADSDYKQLQKLFNLVYESGVLKLYNVDKTQIDLYKLELFTGLCRISGSLSFLVIQILAANNIMAKNDYEKKEHYFNKKCGIAINHLRAPFTVVEGVKVDGGYKLTGTLTWASGYDIFDTLLIGFHCGGLEYEAMAPFKSRENFHIGDADKTFVGYGLNTVNIELKEFFVKDEDIVSSNPIGNYTKVKSASKTVHMCLYGLGGCALDNCNDTELKEEGLKKLEKIKVLFMQSTDTDQMDSLRVELFLLVQNIVTTTMVLIGGKSILADQTLQRVYRELIMFNSNGLNDTLKGLFKKKFLDV